MDTFELDSDAFYICTEVSPRNFVVQKAIQIDKSQIERMLGKLEVSIDKPCDQPTTSSEDTTPSGTSAAHSPSPSTSASTGGTTTFRGGAPPVLPYWFNRECKNQLMMLGPQAQVAPTPSHPPHQFIPALPAQPSPVLTRDEVKQQLKYQLEYYFSRENLISDRYLKCQMDADQYVPVVVIASFPRIERLTTDLDLIKEAAKESSVMELDETEEKVRATTKRTTITIREMPEEYRDEVVKLVADGPEYVDLLYGSNDTWYVMYANELDTQVAYVNVQRKKNEVTGRQVCARIRTGGPPAIAPDSQRNGERAPNSISNSNANSGDTIQMREIGATLSDYGFVPVATFRPTEQCFEYVTPTFSFRGNAYMPQPSTSPLMDPYYTASTTPRNYDELSSASSNSTRTSASFYRSGSRNHNQYDESRGYSNGSDWRSRNGSGSGRYLGNNESNGYRPQANGRGNGYRGGHRGNYQGYQNRQNNHWRTNDNYRAPQSSSSSSSVSSKYFSPEAIETPTNSVPNSPPPVQPAPQVATPSDLPEPPVWPAPSFDKRRKSSETSNVTGTETLTPSTPVTPPVARPVFVEKVHVEKAVEKNGVLEKKTEKVQSPPPPPPPTKAASPPSIPPPTPFSFEETAFPSLPKKPEPERKPQKPTFSSVAAGRRHLKQLVVVPEKKTSYAEKCKKSK